MSFLRKIEWLTLPFLSLTLLCSILGLAIYIPRHGVHPLEPIATAVFVFVVAMVVSGGYHRYFAHKTFQCHPALKLFYLIVGAAAFQQSALVWAADHRYHHRFVDTDKDPYNIKKGFWYAHVGWLLTKDPGHRDQLAEIAPDLVADKWVMWQHRYWIWLSLPLAIGLPLALGLMIDRPFGMLLWAGVLRAVITHHTTFTINSVAHKFGTQPYTDTNSARDVWWLAPILCGENYHNYHHRFQSDYRNGIRWYHWDPTKWALWLLSHTPLVKELRRAPQPAVLRARLEMDWKRLEAKAHPHPSEFWQPFLERLQAMKSGLESAAELYAKARKDFAEFKADVANRSRDSLQQAKEALRERERHFKQQLAEWRRATRVAYQALSGSSGVSA